MSDVLVEEEFLTLDQVAEGPLKGKMSRASLYRIASDGLDPANDSPFHKVRGKWITTRDELVAWIRRQPGGPRVVTGDPMPESTPRETVDDLLATVHEMRRDAA